MSHLMPFLVNSLKEAEVDFLLLICMGWPKAAWLRYEQDEQEAEHILLVPGSAHQVATHFPGASVVRTPLAYAVSVQSFHSAVFRVCHRSSDFRTMDQGMNSDRNFGSTLNRAITFPFRQTRGFKITTVIVNYQPRAISNDNGSKVKSSTDITMTNEVEKMRLKTELLPEASCCSVKCSQVPLPAEECSSSSWQNIVSENQGGDPQRKAPPSSKKCFPLSRN
ncbi:hypothetical protein VNO77_03420 [Canavalia gladiata]|uniref:Uncharacterized protein n=1 Tax=Canavalia gladiata TaxID=3824 RepID=A0AAN9MVH8_CANGL